MWKYVIIIGGFSGIGKEIVKFLVGEGSNILIIVCNFRKLEVVRVEIIVNVVNLK